MQRIGEINKWAAVGGDEARDFPSKKNDLRRVRINVNSAAAVVWYVASLAEVIDKETGEVTRKLGKPEFLARSEGLDQIEFFYGGGFCLSAEGDGYVQSADGRSGAVAKTDHRTFTRIQERRARNYHLELINAKAEKAARDRFKAIEQEAFERLKAATKPEIKNERKPATPPANVDSGPGDGSNAPKKPAKAGGRASPATPATGGDDDDAGTPT